MTDREKILLPSIEAEQHQIREVLRCILHTIIFCRALGALKPQEVDCEILSNITFVKCGDREVDKRVEEKINQFYTWLDRHPGKRGQVSLLFYEKRRKAASWFGKQAEERLYWEQWVIDVSIVESLVSQEEQSSFTLQPVRQRRHSQLQTAVEDRLTLIVRTVNDRKDHIPPVVSPSAVTFPFDISITGEGGLSSTIESVKRMLMHGSPPPVLS